MLSQLGEYEVLQVINFIRAQVASGRDPRPELQAGSSKPWQDEKYLQTVMEEDALLMYDFEGDSTADHPE